MPGDQTELIRRQLRDAFMEGNISRERAAMLADLTVHAVQSSMAKLEEVAALAGSEGSKFSIVLAAAQILQAELEVRIAEMKVTALSSGAPYGEYLLGRQQ